MQSIQMTFLLNWFALECVIFGTTTWLLTLEINQALLGFSCNIVSNTGIRHSQVCKNKPLCKK